MAPSQGAVVSFMVKKQNIYFYFYAFLIFYKSEIIQMKFVLFAVFPPVLNTFKHVFRTYSFIQVLVSKMSSTKLNWYFPDALTINTLALCESACLVTWLFYVNVWIKLTGLWQACFLVIFFSKESADRMLRRNTSLREVLGSKFRPLAQLTTTLMIIIIVQHI